MALRTADARAATATERIIEIAQERPDQPAFRDEAGSISYGALADRSARIASTLVERLPAACSTVPVIGSHGSTVLVQYFGARRSGRLTSVLDARAPEDHLRACLERLEATHVLTDRATAALGGSLVGDDHVLVVEELEDAGSSAALPRLDPEAPAVVLFTSGSTGRPKGVVHAERGMLEFLARMDAAGLFEPTDVFGAISVGTGTAATAALYALMIGATTSGFDLGRRGLTEIPAWIASEGVTIVPMTRGLLRALGDALPPGTTLHPVRAVRTVGEPLLPGDAAAARRYLPADAELRFEFGMNEAGLIAGRVVPRSEDDAERPITVVGAPFPGADVRVVDADGRLLPPGATGEIVVRGGVMLGYLGEPELTAARVRGSGRDREFATGDLGRFHPDGSLEYCGRNDERLKIRNFTIEPAEVEAALLALRGVAEAGVTAAPDAKGAPMLVAYLVPAPRSRLRSPALRAELASRVPAQFVPSLFYAVPELPRTRTGKIDRAALRALAADALAVRPPYEPPVDDRERALQAIVQEILKVDGVGRDDDLFELGADSLDLLELFAALQEQFSVDLPEQTLLEAPTIAELAARLSSPSSPAASTVLLTASGAETPLFVVTGAGSRVFRLRPLARALRELDAERPVRAVPSFTGPLTTRALTEIARARVASVREVQPSGPYLLGGHSAGGLLAYEMARLLREAGESVALLVILDTLLPRSVVGRLRLRHDLARHRWKGSGVHDRLRRAKHLAVHAGRELFGARRGEDERPLRRIRLRPYDGRVLYVAAMNRRQGSFAPDEEVEDVALLQATVTGPITVARVPGAHDSYLDPGNVEAVARAIARELQQLTEAEPA